MLVEFQKEQQPLSSQSKTTELPFEGDKTHPFADATQRWNKIWQAIIIKQWFSTTHYKMLHGNPSWIYGTNHGLDPVFGESPLHPDSLTWLWLHRRNWNLLATAGLECDWNGVASLKVTWNPKHGILLKCKSMHILALDSASLMECLRVGGRIKWMGKHWLMSHRPPKVWNIYIHIHSQCHTLLDPTQVSEVM